MQNLYQPDPLENDFLQELGLIHDYPIHIDVLNNETGFALYVETPATYSDDGDWSPFFGQEREDATKPVHHTEYVPGAAPEYNELNHWYEDDYLRIREVDDAGNPGAWHTIELVMTGFTRNTNPPAALEELGFGRFDSVTWLEGLEPDKDYQVQLWLDMDGDGRFDSQGQYERGINRTYHADGTVTEEPGDWHYWQEPDVYSGIHNLNTDAEDFNVDIDSDGTMDFFIDGVVPDPVQDVGGIMDFFIS